MWLIYITSHIVMSRMITVWLQVTWLFVWRDRLPPFWSCHVEKKKVDHIMLRDQITMYLSCHVTACHVFLSLLENVEPCVFKYGNCIVQCDTPNSGTKYVVFFFNKKKTCFPAFLITQFFFIYESRRRSTNEWEKTNYCFFKRKATGSLHVSSLWLANVKNTAHHIFRNF